MSIFLVYYFIVSLLLTLALRVADGKQTLATWLLSLFIAPPALFIALTIKLLNIKF